MHYKDNIGTSTATMTMTTTSTDSPKRLFISEIKTNIEKHGKRKECRIRCLGMIVFAENNTDNSNTCNQSITETNFTFTIDDGTGILDVISNDAFRNHPKVGDVVDCIGELIWINTSDEMAYKNDCDTSYYPYLQLHYFTCNREDVHKETLRVFEMCSTISSNNKTTGKNDIHKLLGCGDDRPTLDKQDIFRVISSDYSRGGVEVCELVLLFFNTDRYNCPGRSIVQELLQELQIDGAIYKDFNGRYFAL